MFAFENYIKKPFFSFFWKIGILFLLLMSAQHEKTRDIYSQKLYNNSQNMLKSVFRNLLYQTKNLKILLITLNNMQMSVFRNLLCQINNLKMLSIALNNMQNIKFFLTIYKSIFYSELVFVKMIKVLKKLKNNANESQTIKASLYIFEEIKLNLLIHFSS